MNKKFLLILSLLYIIVSGCVSDPNTYYFNVEEICREKYKEIRNCII